MKKFKNIILLMMILLLSCAGKDEKDDPRLRLKYINLKYMFTLQFPEKWINYMDFEKTEIIDPQLIIPVIYFALPTRSREWQSLVIPAGYADLFYIRIFSKEQYKLYKEKYKESEEFRMSDIFPGETKQFVYMIRYSSSIPVDLYIYMKESHSITDTFRMIKQD
jgi:hypothetical protein